MHPVLIPSIMQYNPDLSIRENAIANNVSDAAVRKYIRVHKIDRRNDEKAKRAKIIHQLQMEHPDWSAKRIAKELGVSPTTVCSYLQGVSTDTASDKWSVVKVKEGITFDGNTPIDFLRMEEYDGSKMDIIVFSKGTFKYNGHSIGFSNMRNFPIDFFGERFLSVETAYIACCYGLNNPDCIRIQREIQAYTNSKKCKNDYRKRGDTPNEIEDRFGRKDFHNSIWHYNLMLYLVWLKCQTHAEFREMLLATSDNTAIIENQNEVKYVKEGDWGCLNHDAKLAYRRRSRELQEEGMSEIRSKEEANIETWNVGVWKGMNHCGKILMACRAALRSGSTPNINFQALNDAEIYLFGKRLTFNNFDRSNKSDYQRVIKYSKEELLEVSTYDPKEVVAFRNKGKNSILSNFHPFKFSVGGVTFHSVEQFYHWKRLQGNPKYQETLLSYTCDRCSNCCFNYTRNKGVKKVIEKDLDKRIEYMREGLRYKLKYCNGFKEALLKTGDKPLAEINQTSKDDDIWAVDKNTLVGSNILGKLLMELRSEIVK